MNKINRKVEYALIALKHISGKYAGQRTTVKEICTATHIPFDATSRVMQQMAQQSILQAEQGKNGGYLLIKDLSKVAFLEIVEIICGKIEVVRCVAGVNECEFSLGCDVSSPLKNFNEKISDFYRSLSVSDLLQVRESARDKAQKQVSP